MALIIVLFGAAAIRARLLDVPLERDEGGYAYFAEQMLAGDPPFVSGYTMHVPGTAAAYATAMSAFGQTTRGVRLGLVVVNAATVLFVFLLARSLYGPLGAVAAAVTYATLSLSPDMLGPFGHATHFVALPAVAGLWAFVHALGSRRLAWFAVAGLVLGIAPIMKQSGAAFPAFALCWLIWSRARERGSSMRGVAREATVLVGSSLVAPTATLGLLAAAGVLHEAWRWLFAYAGAYAGMQRLGDGLAILGTRLSSIVPASIGFAVLATAGLLLADARDTRRASPAGRGFAAALLAFSFASVAAGLYFRHHYFILMLPAVALLCGRSVGVVSRMRRVAAVGGLAATLLSCGQALIAHGDVLFALSPVEVSRQIYGANPFPESVEVGRYLAANTSPADRIAILGSEPQICFYAHRKSATRYLYLYPLVEPNPFGPAMKEELIHEVEVARPAYVVWVDVPSSWNSRVQAARPLVLWADAFLQTHYDLVGRVAIRGPNRTEYAWEADAHRLGPAGANLLIFRRRGP
jgi:hypothetical protein